MSCLTSKRFYRLIIVILKVENRFIRISVYTENKVKLKETRFKGENWGMKYCAEKIEMKIKSSTE